MVILSTYCKLSVILLSFADAAAIKRENDNKGLSDSTRASSNANGTSTDSGQHNQPELLKNLGVFDNNRCNKARANEMNKLLAKLFHHNALPFNLVESDELKEFIKALNPAYYQQGIPGRFWMETTGVDLAYDEIYQDVEEHLRGCDALMANMDGWENEKKQQLKIITLSGKNFYNSEHVIMYL